MMLNPPQAEPADTLMAEWHQAWKILNDFRALGFTRRDAFIQVIQQYDPNYMEYKNTQKLISFWQLRLRNDHVNQDLLKILEQLKTE
jgi:hypothetical protein